VDVDHGAIGDGEDVLAEAVVLLDPLTVAVEESVVVDLGPVDGEGLGGLDADAVYRDAKVSVEVGLAASGGREPALPLRGGLIAMAGWRLMATSGASTSRLPIIKASSESALRRRRSGA
jgi:hypothetical protein